MVRLYAGAQIRARMTKDRLSIIEGIGLSDEEVRFTFIFEGN